MGTPRNMPAADRRRPMGAPPVADDAGLETRLRALDGGWVSAPRLLRLLEALEPPPGDAGVDDGALRPASSLYLAAEDAAELRIPAGGPEAAATDAQDAARWWGERLVNLAPVAARNRCGLVALHNGRRGLLISPPFPVAESRLPGGWDTAPLRRMLTGDFVIGVVLVRLGRFAVAVYRGGGLAASKTGARYVKGKHHAGGTSQLRYTRIREGQAQRLYGKVCEAVRAQLTPIAGELDYVALGGDQFTLNACLKACPALAALRPITLPRRLNIRDPKRDTLESVGQMLRESRAWPL